MKENLKSTQEVEVQETGSPIIILNADGFYVGANEKGLDCHRYSREELLGMNCDDTVATEKIYAGASLQRVIEGEKVETELHIRRGDGSSYIAEVVGVPIEVDGTTYAKVTTEKIKEFEQNESTTDIDESNFSHINAAELEQITQNIRVEAPSGKLPLNAIMLDLAVGHNELEQYKEGALSLYKAVDERLQEEEEHNPDSKACDVLREVKKTAFGLYLRIQRGDEELHGNRDGKYSGYFN